MSKIRFARARVNGLHPITQQIVELVARDPRSNAAIAREIGVSYNVLQHWNTGRNEPRLAAAVDALDVLGYEINIVRKS